MIAAQVVARAMSQHSQLAAKLGPALEPFRDKHAGQECLILGNGPSLLQHNLATVPENVVTIGLNGSWRVYERPTYHVCIDDGPHYRGHSVRPEHLALVSEADMAKIKHTGNGGWWFDEQAKRGGLFSTPAWPCGIHLFFANHANWPEKFSPDVAKCGVVVSVDGCGSVAYVALQLADFMGFSRIWLAGFDQSVVKFTGQTAAGEQARLFRHTPARVRERLRVIAPTASKLFEVSRWPWGAAEGGK